MYIFQLFSRTIRRLIYIEYVIKFQCETISVACPCFYIHYWNSKEETENNRKFANCSLNESQEGKNRSSQTNELLTSEMIQSIENTWLRR
jgi:hypothetical protein